MFKLRVLQAEFGDCLILEYGTAAQPRYILIDGGPSSIYENHLREELRAIAASGGELEVMVLSHVDKDHVIGLLDLTAELREQRGNGVAETIVEREALAFPITGDTELAVLVGDAGVRNRLPFPRTFDELLAPQIVARQPFFA